MTGPIVVFPQFRESAHRSSILAMRSLGAFGSMAKSLKSFPIHFQKPMGLQFT